MPATNRWFASLVSRDPEWPGRDSDGATKGRPAGVKYRGRSRLKCLVMVVTVAVGAASVGWANCQPPRPLWDEVNASAAVFAGEVQARRDSFAVDTVTSRQYGGMVGTDWGTILEVKVLRSWKGLRADSVVTMVARDEEGPRGLPFVVGERYLIYAVMIEPSWGGWYAGWGGRLLIGACGRTRALWMAGADLRQLGLVASDAEWLRGVSAPPGVGSTETTFLADSLARLRARPEHRRSETGTRPGRNGRVTR